MERIILDVDTGLDDAVALFLAAGLQEFTIEAVIATAGKSSKTK
jgi:ribosylpyrimidine nucleosidase